VIILQYRNAGNSGERAESATHVGKTVLIEVYENADHQIGTIDLLNFFLLDGLDFHCSNLETGNFPCKDEMPETSTLRATS
jgi:hypothetical protein